MEKKRQSPPLFRRSVPLAVLLLAVAVLTGCSGNGSASSGSTASAASSPSSVSPVSDASSADTGTDMQEESSATDLTSEQPVENSSGADASGPGSPAGSGASSEDSNEAESGSAENAESPESAGGTADATDAAPLPLFTFCNDPELNEWAASFKDAVPQKMTAIMLGEGPVYMEFTDPELISKTAEALSTVMIGGISSEDPRNVADAGGWAYYFENKNGKNIGFSFELGTFAWKNNDFHKVADWGDLTKVNEVLLKIGNPQNQYVYSEDDGFYTKYLETGETDWEEEDGVFGGILIYPDPDSENMFVSIGRIAADQTDAEDFLKTTLRDYLEKKAEDYGGTVESGGTVVNYAVGKKQYPSMLYRIRMEDGTAKEMLNVIRTEEEDLTGDICLIRFSAVYDPDDSDIQKSVMKALDLALKEFYFHYREYPAQEVQPGETLIEFCNNIRLTRWTEEFENHFPREVVYTSDRWHVISDPDSIRLVLDALKTVRIGGVSDKHVGGSGRQIFDFIDEDGDSVTFAFFRDTFDWNGESYDVLDWGKLADLDLLSYAEP